MSKTYCNIHMVKEWSKDCVDKILSDEDAGIVISECDIDEPLALKLVTKGLKVFRQPTVDEIKQNGSPAKLIKWGGAYRDILGNRRTGADWSEYTTGSSWRWFGDAEIGFRYTKINIELFRHFGMRVNGCYAIYVELGNGFLPEIYKDDMFNLFVEEVCEKDGVVCLPEWRYKILDNSNLSNNTGADESYLFTFCMGLSSL